MTAAGGNGRARTEAIARSARRARHGRRARAARAAAGNARPRASRSFRLAAPPTRCRPAAGSRGASFAAAASKASASPTRSARISTRNYFCAPWGAKSSAWDRPRRASRSSEDFLHAAGVADGDVVLSDGSGLARDDLVTPRAMVALLRYAARQPWGTDFLSTLPVAGVDGTLEDRMKNTRRRGADRGQDGRDRTRARAFRLRHDAARRISGLRDFLQQQSAARRRTPTRRSTRLPTAMVETLGAATASAQKKK